MVGNQAPGLNIFSKRVIFALSKPYPLFLCTCINTPLKCFFSVPSVGQPPSREHSAAIYSTPFFLPLSCNLSYFPSLISNVKKKKKKTENVQTVIMRSIFLSLLRYCFQAYPLLTQINFYQSSLRVWMLL